MRQAAVCLFFTMITISYACKEFSEVKVSAQRGMSMQRMLWQKLIGRNMIPAEMQAYRCVGKSKQACYQETLNKILAADVWYDEGFFHLHRQRLLLHPLSVSAFPGNSLHASDYRALQLEMREVARADNYWQLLNYRERWIDIATLSNDMRSCRKYLRGWDNAPKECMDSLQREFFTKASKNSPLHKSLCTGATADSRLAQLNRGYQRLFAVDFCEVSKQVTLPWVDSSDLTDILSFLAAVTAAAKLDFFPEFTVLTDTAGKPLIDIDSRTDVHLKIRFPATLQGIHANPHWLTKHSTSPLNQHLHRAKIIWHSWFCQRIAPDNARPKTQKNESEMTAAELAAWQKFQDEQEAASIYFAENDSHAKGDQLCFNCHRRIQPVANYFGGLNMRQDGYNTLGYDVGDFFAQEAPHTRPGGYWDDDSKHFLTGVDAQGMAGLAQLLSTLPRVRSCIVKSSWNHFFGSDYALNSEEVAAAATFFTETGFNYRKLLQHLLQREEAIVYFTAGEQQFHELMAQKRLTCELAYEKAQRESQTSAAATVDAIIAASCHDCHADYGIEIDLNDPATILDMIVDGGRMPLDGDYALLSGYTQEQSNDIQRKALQCYFKTQLGGAVPAPTALELTRKGHLVDGREAGQ